MVAPPWQHSPRTHFIDFGCALYVHWLYSANTRRSASQQRQSHIIDYRIPDMDRQLHVNPPSLQQTPSRARSAPLTDRGTAHRMGSDRSGKISAWFSIAASCLADCRIDFVDCHYLVIIKS